MSSSRSKLLARLALVIFTAGCAAWIARLDYGRKISTNVLDLIPASEQSPEVALVRNFANDIQSRVMLFALRDPAHPGVAPAEAAHAFAAKLKVSPLFADAVALGDSDSQQELGRALFEHRFEFLLPGWLGDREREFAATRRPPAEFSAWLAEQTAAQLEAFLRRPEATAMESLIPADPLLLLPSLAQQVQLVAPGQKARDHALVWARIKASPLAEEGQEPVFSAVASALTEVRGAHPGVELQWSGINRFAAASRARIEAEIRLLNIFSIAAVLAISAVFVRRVFKILHLLPVILLSIAGAWTVSTLVFDRLHVLVFVIGSLLSGVAIDYGIYIYMQPALRPDEPYGSKLGRLLKPLLASCLTTVIGFSLLLFSDLPLIRQIGLFVAAGLLSALAVAMLYFAQLDRPFLAARQFGRRGTGDRPGVRWLTRLLLAAAVVVALTGPWRLQWRDDIHELDIPSPQLTRNETELRALFGENEGRTAYLTYGDTVAEARERLQVFLDHDAGTSAAARRSSLGAVLPTPTDWTRLAPRVAGLPAFADDFRAALERHGFSADAFGPFFQAWSDLRAHPPGGDFDALAGRLRPLLTGPLAMLASSHAPFWFLTLADDGGAPPPGLHTVSVSQLETLNSLFTRYRWSALRLSLIGLALVIASVFAIYPFRRGLRIALIPAGACFVVFGLYGLAGQPLNLFHLLGAFLGVCLSHNYAIFSSDNAAAGTSPPVPIRLSALSTATSFGVLAFSHIPVIHALGLTVSLIVLIALSVVELEPFARFRRP